MASNKKIMLVYQDCAMCGRRKGWGEEQTKVADTYGFEIVKTPFTKPGVKDLIWTAVTKGGIKSLPFFTDGEKFSKKLVDFVETKKTTKKEATKKVKEADDGDTKES